MEKRQESKNIKKELLKSERTQLTRDLAKVSPGPKMLKKIITMPILEKGDNENPCNYRGINLPSSAMKTLTRILKINDKNESI